MNEQIAQAYDLIRNQILEDPEVRDAWIASIRSVLAESICVSHDQLARNIVARLVGVK